MKFAACSLAGLLALAVFSAPTSAQGGEVAADHAENWKGDLEFMRHELSGKAAGLGLNIKRDMHGVLPHGQKNFEQLYPNFNADLEALEGDLPKLEDGEIVLRIMKIIASANVGHNAVQQPGALGFYAKIPLQFGWYPDGLALVGAAAEYSKALGAHVLKIGDKTPDEVLAALAPYISHDNDAGLKENAPPMLRPAAVLKHLGLIGADGRVVFTLRKTGEEPFQLAVRPGDPRVALVSVLDALHVKMPLSRTRQKDNYWFQYLADSNTMFIQYNRSTSDPAFPFHHFASDVLAEIDRYEKPRIVVDLRFNIGGDARVIVPLRAGLEQRVAQEKLGSIVMLIGGGTMGTAMLNATEFQSFLHAKLVGEATGSNASSYGDMKTLTLPFSRLIVQYTTKYLGERALGDVNVLKPDVEVHRTFDDILAGRDRALEAAIAVK